MPKNKEKQPNPEKNEVVPPLEATEKVGPDLEQVVNEAKTAVEENTERALKALAKNMAAETRIDQGLLEEILGHIINKGKFTQRDLINTFQSRGIKKPESDQIKKVLEDKKLITRSGDVVGNFVEKVDALNPENPETIESFENRKERLKKTIQENIDRLNKNIGALNNAVPPISKREEPERASMEERLQNDLQAKSILENIFAKIERAADEGELEKILLEKFKSATIRNLIDIVFTEDKEKALIEKAKTPEWVEKERKISELKGEIIPFLNKTNIFKGHMDHMAFVLADLFFENPDQDVTGFAQELQKYLMWDENTKTLSVKSGYEKIFEQLYAKIYPPEIIKLIQPENPSPTSASPLEANESLEDRILTNKEVEGALKAMLEVLGVESITNVAIQTEKNLNSKVNIGFTAKIKLVGAKKEFLLNGAILNNKEKTGIEIVGPIVEFEKDQEGILEKIKDNTESINELIKIQLTGENVISLRVEDGRVIAKIKKPEKEKKGDEGGTGGGAGTPPGGKARSNNTHENQRTLLELEADLATARERYAEELVRVELEGPDVDPIASPMLVAENNYKKALAPYVKQLRLEKQIQAKDARQAESQLLEETKNKKRKERENTKGAEEKKSAGVLGGVLNWAKKFIPKNPFGKKSKEGVPDSVGWTEDDEQILTNLHSTLAEMLNGEDMDALVVQGLRDKIGELEKQKAEFEQKNEKVEDLRQQVEGKKQELETEKIELEKLKKVDENLKATANEKASEIITIEQAERTESFNSEYIKSKIEELMKTFKEIEGFGEIDIKFENNQILARVNKIKAKGTEIEAIEIRLTNNGNSLMVENHRVIADFATRNLVNLFVGGEIKKAHIHLKDYIQKEKGREVEKIWIEGEELKVMYEDNQAPENDAKKQKIEAVRVLNEQRIQVNEDINDKEKKINELEAEIAKIEKELEELEGTNKKKKGKQAKAAKPESQPENKKEETPRETWSPEDEEELDKKLKEIEKKENRLKKIKIEVEKLEDEKKNPYKHQLSRKNLSYFNVKSEEDLTLEVINERLKPAGIDGRGDMGSRYYSNISKQMNGIVEFSVYGFYIQCTNLEEVGEGKYEEITKNDNAKFQLVRPDGTTSNEKTWKETYTMFWQEIEDYKESELAKFDKDTNTQERRQEEIQHKLEELKEEREKLGSELPNERTEVEQLQIKKYRSSKYKKRERFISPETETKYLIYELRLENLMPQEFYNLDESQKLKVVQDLKKRIVNIVKIDAETQYSEEIKAKMKEAAGDNMARILATLQNASTSLSESFQKETRIKNIEKEIFEEIKNTPAGQKLIYSELNGLISRVKKMELEIDRSPTENTPWVVFIPTNYFVQFVEDQYKDRAINAVIYFNESANEFREMPYEWGTENATAKQREKYNKAKEKYEKNKANILDWKIKGEKISKAQAMTELYQLNADILADQLLNTHPEFEKEFNSLENEAGVKEVGRTLARVAGLDSMRKLKFRGASTGARTVAKGAGFWVGGTAGTMGVMLALPLIGAGLGYLRGKASAIDTLEKRTKEARYGKKDESKEKAIFTKATHLQTQLEKLTNRVKNSSDDADLLNKRIDFTIQKLEAGLVDFGEVKDALMNQMALLEALNEAIIVKESVSEKTKQDVEDRINNLLSIISAREEKRISEAREEFIKKQAKKGALIGAGAGLFADLVLVAHEQHWFGWGENTSTEEKQEFLESKKGEIKQDEELLAQKEKEVEALKADQSKAEEATRLQKELEQEQARLAEEKERMAQAEEKLKQEMAQKEAEEKKKQEEEAKRKAQEKDNVEGKPESEGEKNNKTTSSTTESESATESTGEQPSEGKLERLQKIVKQQKVELKKAEANLAKVLADKEKFLSGVGDEDVKEAQAWVEREKKELDEAEWNETFARLYPENEETDTDKEEASQTKAKDKGQGTNKDQTKPTDNKKGGENSAKENDKTKINKAPKKTETQRTGGRPTPENTDKTTQENPKISEEIKAKEENLKQAINNEIEINKYLTEKEKELKEAEEYLKKLDPKNNEGEYKAVESNIARINGLIKKHRGFLTEQEAQTERARADLEKVTSSNPGSNTVEANKVKTDLATAKEKLETSSVALARAKEQLSFAEKMEETEFKDKIDPAKRTENIAKLKEEVKKYDKEVRQATEEVDKLESQAKSLQEKTINEPRKTSKQISGTRSDASTNEQGIPSPKEKITAENGTEINKESIVKSGKGITQAFKAQIEANPGLAKKLQEQIKFEGDTNSREFYEALGKKFGYIKDDGSWIGVKGKGGDTAYQFEEENGQLVVREYHKVKGDWQILEKGAHKSDGVFEDKIEDKYEYYDGKKSTGEEELEQRGAKTPGPDKDQTPLQSREPNKIKTTEKLESRAPEELKSRKPNESYTETPKKQPRGTSVGYSTQAGYSTEAAYRTTGAYGSRYFAYGPGQYGGTSLIDVIIHNAKLAENQVDFVFKKYDENLNEILEGDIKTWQKVRGDYAYKIWEKGSPGKIENNKDELAHYINMLADASKVRPYKSMSAFDNKETVETYMFRALAELEKNGQLDQFQARFKDTWAQIEGHPAPKDVEDLDVKTLARVDKIEEENIKEVFPQIYEKTENRDLLIAQARWKTSLEATASAVLNKDNKLSEEMMRLRYYLEDLKKDTGLEPEEGEKVKDYVDRALKQAAADNKLGKVRLGTKELDKYPIKHYETKTVEKEDEAIGTDQSKKKLKPVPSGENSEPAQNKILKPVPTKNEEGGMQQNRKLKPVPTTGGGESDNESTTRDKRNLKPTPSGGK